MAIATNTFSTSSLVAKALVKALRNNSVLASRVRSDFTNTFKDGDYKSGDTITIKLPPRYVSATGAAIQKNNTTNSTVSLTLTQRNIGIGALSKDLTVSVAGLMQFLDPIASQLMSDIESDGFALYYKAENLVTPGSMTNGIPAAWTGAEVATLKPFLDAKARMTEKAIPTDGQRYVAITPANSAGVVDGLKGLFQAADEIADQYKKGLMGMTAGFEFLETQCSVTHTNGTRTNTTPLIDGNQTGASILLKGAGNAVTIKRGDQFTIGGVFQINPLTRDASNKLQVFSVQADATTSAGGAVTVTVLPSINVTSPNQTVSAQAADGATVTWMGAASASTEVNLAWHKDAMAVAFVPMVTDFPGAECDQETDPVTGITVRVTKQGNVETDEVVWRADVLYGFTVIRGAGLVRIQG